MPQTSGPPRFGINLIKVGQVSVVGLLWALVPMGRVLIMSMLGTLITFIVCQRWYSVRIERHVTTLHSETARHLQTGQVARLRREIGRWHWLCLFGCAGVYDAWGRLSAAEGHHQLALSYYHRALRAGLPSRNLEIQVSMVRLHQHLGALSHAESLARQLLRQYPHDLFLRYRLEQVLGDECIAQLT